MADMKLDSWKLLDEQDELGEDGAGGLEEEASESELIEASEAADRGEAAEETPDEEAEEEEQSLLDLVREAGLDIEAPDDFAAAKAIIDRAKQSKELQERQAQLEQQRQTELAMWQRLQQPQQPPATRKGPLDELPENSRLRHWKQKPEWDPLWLTKLVRDEKGNVTAAPGEDPQLPYKVRAYLDWEERAKRIQTEDPLGFFWDVATAHPEFTGALNTLIESRVAEAVAAIKGESLIEKSRSELYDDKGNLNEFGKAYAAAVEDYRRIGITDPQIVHPRALLMARASVPPTAKPTPDSRTEKRFKWMKNAATKAKGKGSKPGSSTKASADPNDLRDSILAEFAALGTGPHDLVR